MKNFLSIMKYEDFMFLYNNSYVNISYSKEFDGNIENIKDYNLYLEITEKHNINEITRHSQFAFIHFTYNEDNTNGFKLSYQNINSIYILDKDMKKELGNNDSNIKTKFKFLSDEILSNIQIEMNYKKAKIGADNVWKVLDLKQEDKEKCEEKINKNVILEAMKIKGRLVDINNETSIWTRLLSYNDNKSPLNTINKKYKPLYKLLDVYYTYGFEEKFDKIDKIAAIHQLENRQTNKESIDDIINELKSESADWDLELRRLSEKDNIDVIVILAFFKYKELCKDKITNDILEHIKNDIKIDNNYYLTLYLLGCFSGQKGTIELLVNKDLENKNNNIDNKQS